MSVIFGNKKPISTKYSDVNRALTDVYDTINKLAQSVNSSRNSMKEYEGKVGDLRVTDKGLQYRDKTGWKTLALGGSENTPLVSQSLQVSGMTYPISDGSANQSITTDGSGKLNFVSHLPLTGGTISGDTTLSSSTASKPLFTIKNTHSGATSGILQFVKDKGAAGADGDDLGAIYFNGDNSAQEQTSFAKILAEVSEADDTDEAGKLSFYVAESDGSSSQLTAGLVIEGEHATDGQVDVNIGAGTGSTTTIAGILDIDGSKQTTAGNFEIETTGHFVVDSGDDIKLDSHSGNFVAQKQGTEFSAANSAYAGMILGYTALGADANATYYAVTNAYAVISDDHKITFTAPPSGKVEIEASCYMDVVSSAARPLYLSLSTANATTGYASLDVQHEHIVAHADETDSTGIINKWVIESLTAGSSYTFWVGTKSTHNSNLRLYWGGDTTSEYAPFIIKATALPATIYDG